MKTKTLLLALTAATYTILPSCNNSQAGIQTSSAATDVPTTAESHVKSARELRQELKLQEEASPTAQLSATGTIQENRILIQKPDFFHHSVYQTDGCIIHGSIHNKASIARFKDAVVQVTYYSETQTNLGSTNYVVYKYIEPGGETSFDIKVYPPVVMRNFSLSIVSSSLP